MKRIATALSVAIIISVATASYASDHQAEAKERFEKGVILFKEGDFEAALVEFKAAYKAEPHYAVLYNVGITLYKLHRYAEAAFQLNAYIQEGGDKIDEERRTEITDILDEIDALVGTVKIICDVESHEVLVDGEKVVSGLLRLDVGEYKIEVHAPGYEPFVKTLEVPGGQVVSLEVTLDALGKTGGVRKKIEPTSFFALLGVTGALALTAIITGSVALKREDEYAGLEYEDNWKSFQEATRRLTIATDVFWGLAGAAAIAIIVLAVKTDFRKETAEEDIALIPSISPFGMHVRWGF